MTDLPRPKRWRYPVVASEHLFDKLWRLDLTFGEFRALIDGDAEVIEESPAGNQQIKELVLYLDWRVPLHVVIVVDDLHHEERLITVYEPSSERWTTDFRKRR